MAIYMWRDNTVTESYVLDNIPATDTNKYINVAKSWFTIQSVKFNFTATWAWTFVHISSNNSNRNRYGIACGYTTSGTFWNSCAIRWRLNWASDTWYRQVAYSRNSTNEIELYINRDGNCYVMVNWVKTEYTAGTAELNIITTIMNYSNMNCYASQDWALITWNNVDIEITYEPN